MTTKRLITAALAVLMLAAMPSVAVAQDATTDERATNPAERTEERTATEAEWVENLKARALEAIDKRLATLSDLESAIVTSEHLTPDHAALLTAEVGASAAGLEALADEIGTAPDLETLRALVPKIFEDYRIYAIVVPKVHLVIGADAASAVADRLQEAAGSIEDVLDRLEEAGFNVAEGYRLLDDMTASVLAGAEQADSVAPMVIGLSPSDYPDSTEVLRSAHATLQGAGSELRSAGETAHEIGRFIKGLFGGDED